MERRLVRIIKITKKKILIALKIVSMTQVILEFFVQIFYKNEKIVFSGFEIPRTRSVDIDTMEDWNLAIKLYK